MAERAWVDTGHYEHINNPSDIDRIPPFDPRSGDHYWIVTTAYHVDPSAFTSGNPDVTPLLDHETLAVVAGPGCYYCEQSYSQRLATRRCKGNP